MQPNQPIYGSPPAPNLQNPYEFIINPDKPSRKMPPLFGFLRNRLVMVLGAGILAIVVLIILSKIIFSGPNLSAYQTVADDQSYIIKVSQLALQQQSIAAPTQNAAVTEDASLASSLNRLVTALANNGLKLNTAAINSLQVSSASQTLSTAAGNGNYDSVYLSLMNTYLTKYRQAVASAYADNDSGAATKALLKFEYQNGGLLLTQVGQAEQELGQS